METSVEMAQEQKNDVFLNNIYLIKTNTPLPDTVPEDEKSRLFEMASKVLLKEDGCLYYEIQSRNCTKQLMLIPDTLKSLVFEAYHSSQLSGGHMSWRKTLAKIMRKYYWPSIYADIRQWCTQCMACQLRRQ
ncbi:unnamed protein product, partial [Cylicostephanus goldi]